MFWRIMNGEVSYSSILGKMIAKFFTQVFSPAICMKLLNMDPFLAKKISLISFVGRKSLAFETLKVKCRISGIIIGIGGIIFPTANRLDRRWSPDVRMDFVTNFSCPRSFAPLFDWFPMRLSVFAGITSAQHLARVMSFKATMVYFFTKVMLYDHD